MPVEGESFSAGTSNFSYTSSANESFIYYDAEQSWLDASTNSYNNVCIKAFTDDKAVTFSESSVTIGNGESYALKYQLADKGKSIAFSSSDENIVSVSSKGKITAKGVGTATITATADSDDSTTMKVTVKKAPSKITATPKSKTIKKGKSFTIKTKLSSGSASKKITFKSSNTKVASVSSTGKVKAKKQGNHYSTDIQQEKSNRKGYCKIKNSPARYLTISLRYHITPDCPFFPAKLMQKIRGTCLTVWPAAHPA